MENSPIYVLYYLWFRVIWYVVPVVVCSILLNVPKFLETQFVYANRCVNSTCSYNPWLINKMVN